MRRLARATRRSRDTSPASSLVELPKVDRRRRHPAPLAPVLDQRHRAPDLVLAAGEPLQHARAPRPRRAACRRGAVQSDHRVDAQHESAGPRPRRPRLAQRVLPRRPPRLARPPLVDVGGAHLERNAELLEDRRAVAASATRVSAACVIAACDGVWRSSGKNSAISRSAVSGRVRAVHEVERDLDREVAADRTGRSLERIGRADHLSRRCDRALSLEHHRDQRTARDELDQLAEERLLGVLGVVALGELASRPASASARRSAGPCARSGRSPRR